MITRIGVQPVVASVGQANARQTYRVVEVSNVETGETGDQSNEVSCTNDLDVDGNVNIIHWSGETAHYKVYRSSDGPFRKIADVEGFRCIDDGPEPE